MDDACLCCCTAERKDPCVTCGGDLQRRGAGTSLELDKAVISMITSGSHPPRIRVLPRCLALCITVSTHLRNPLPPTHTKEKNMRQAVGRLRLRLILFLYVSRIFNFFPTTLPSPRHLELACRRLAFSWGYRVLRGLFLCPPLLFLSRMPVGFCLSALMSF